MAGNGRHPTMRVDRDGADACAKAVADRIWRRKIRHRVFVLETSGVVVRTLADAEGYDRGQVVGDFDHRARWQDIAIAIRLAMQRPRPQVREESMPRWMPQVPGLGSPMLGAADWRREAA